MISVYKRKEITASIFFILPSFTGIMLFYVVPYMICLAKSFFKGQDFVGFQNYLETLSNEAFLLALRNTGIFMGLGIPLLLIVSFCIAHFLNSFKEISAFFRSSLLIPVVIPTASVVCVWQILFDDFGVVNGLLTKMGISTVDFFSSGFSMVMIILIYVWKYCGFCVIIFSSGLAKIPKVYYEDARLMGAGKFTLVRKITLPLLVPTSFFAFLMAVIYSFKISREVFALFGEYPTEEVYFLQNFISNNYNNLNYGRLSCASLLLSVFIVALILIFFLFERKRNYLE